MKYIRIKNNGHIEPEALSLVGASSKRSDTNKIGMFGSGNKYALAYFLRNNYGVKIWAGLDEITVETKEHVFRDGKYNVIYINGKETSITSDMGKDWKFWQAIREIYCNALDEGGCSIDYVNHITPEDGTTHFYIDMKQDVKEFVVNFDNYFATTKKVVFECEAGRILEKSGSEANIYRKGIRCFETNKASVYDYDFVNIDIDENRLVKYFWQTEGRIWNLIYQCTNKEVIMHVLRHCSDSNYLEGTLSGIGTLNATKVSDEFRECMQVHNFAPKGYAGLLKPDEVHNHIILPTQIFNSVREHIPDKNVGDRFKTTIKGAMYREIEMDELQKATVDRACEFLMEAGVTFDYPIVAAIFDDKDVYGAALDGKILLSDIRLGMGVNDVVVTIIEEYIHLKYNCADETRDFQTAVITEFVTHLKKTTAFLI